MARSRNIKPGFFRNADLAELAFETRLLFIGLWTLCDREGRLEDRPKQIKMDLFPADNLDCEAMLQALAETTMLTRYAHGGKRYLQIVNFLKHQNPHRDECQSAIPAPGSPVVNDGNKSCESDASIVQTLDKHGASMVAIRLNPDSGFLNPDSLIPDSILRQPAVVVPKHGQSTKKQSLPENFEPNSTGKGLIESNGLNLSYELDAFKNHHIAKGSLMADWQAAFRTWIGNAAKFNAHSTKRTGSSRHTGFDKPGYYGDLQNGIPD